MKIERVYIAGPITPRSEDGTNHSIEYLGNVRSMIRTGIDVINARLIPYIPALDFVTFLLLREDEQITESHIKRLSKNWLSVCHAVLLIPGWHSSPGTRAEVNLAHALGIPVFESLGALLRARNEEE